MCPYLRRFSQPERPRVVAASEKLVLAAHVPGSFVSDVAPRRCEQNPS